jgi:hypothetical protein
MALRADYAARGLLLGGSLKEAQDDFDAFEARLKLPKFNISAE